MNALRGFIPHAGIAKDGCHLWLAGDQVNPTKQGAILQSENGGLTYQSVATWPQAFHVWGISRNANGTFWVAAESIVGSGLLYKSNDNGQNWVDVALPFPTTVLTAIAATDSGIWVAGKDKSSAFIYMSADEGNHWQEALKIPSSTSHPVKFSAIAAKGTTIIGVGFDGSRGVIAVGLNGGTSFQLATDYGNATGFWAIDLIDSTHAYVGGDYTATGRFEDASAVFLQTSDGGTTFKPIVTPNKAADVVAALFLSPERGYTILTVGNTVGPYAVHSDSGNNLTWEPMALMPKPDFGGVERLFAADDGTVFAVGLGGLYRIAP